MNSYVSISDIRDLKVMGARTQLEMPGQVQHTN